jgi:8-oxo-dGTP pyrophosphatase MutT (NUDIX family)
MDEGSVPTWTVEGQRTLLDCRVFSIEERRMRQNAGEADGAAEREGDFYILKTNDWVNVVALTDADELVMIEQWRQGVLRVTLEIPGGIVDPGESPLDAAIRELAEETGYVAREWRSLGSIEPNPAIQDNRCHTFLALGARASGETAFDAHEQCRVVIAPWAESGALLASGRITHALVAVALSKEGLRRAGVLDAPLTRSPRSEP